MTSSPPALAAHPLRRWPDAFAALNPAAFASARTRASSPLAGRSELLAEVCEALEVLPGHTVLEIGTGVSYSTALLCHVLGDTAITTIQDDKAAAATARALLTQRGYRPYVVTGQGLHGYQGRGPYDRVLSLRSVWRVPATWVGQTRRDGGIITPLGAHGDVVFTLRVADDLASATGRALPLTIPPRAFTPLPPAGTLPPLVPEQSGRLPTSATGPAWPAQQLAALVGHDRAFDVFLGLVMPALDHYDLTPTSISHTAGSAHAAGAGHVWVDRAHTPSWACLHPGGHITHGGPRPLAPALVALADWWIGADMPALHRWGLTAHADGSHTLWIDQPTGRRLDLPPL